MKKVKYILFLSFTIISLSIILLLFNSKDLFMNQEVNLSQNEQLYSNEEYVTFVNLTQFKISDLITPIFTPKDGFHLVSYIRDNKKILLEENIYNGASIEKEDLNNIYSKDYYTEESTQYNLLTSDDILIKGNGTWEYLTSKVKYINYHVDKNISPKQTWVDYFSDKLISMSGQTNTPIIITDSWEFMWEGKLTEIVVASNIIVTENISNPLSYDASFTPLIPSGQNHVMYKMSALFLDGTPINLSVNDICDKYRKISSIPIQTNISSNESLYSACSFIPPNNNQEFEYVYDCAQIDKNNNIIYYPVFIESNSYYGSYRDFDYTLRFLIADIDGDTKTELLVYNKGYNSYNFRIIAYTLDNENLIEHIIK